MKVRITVPGTVGKSVNFDPRSGARAEAAVAALREQISAGFGGTIQHNSLLGLQIGDDHPQYTMWQANETIQGQWNFQTIPFIQGDTLAEYIEDVIGRTIPDFLQDTSSVVWTYHDTANLLEANVPPEFVQDTVGAMLTDSTSIDFTYNDPAGTFTASTINANPTGTIGLAAVNGSAATPMRSDAAPALSQAIAPTWTGEHIWTNAKAVFQTATYTAVSPNVTLAQLDALGTAPISFMTEHSIRVLRENSPNFTGISWGAALPGNPAGATTDDILLTLRGDAYDSSVASAADHFIGAEMQIIASENWSSTAHGARFSWSTTPIGAVTLAEVMVLTDKGNLQIQPTVNQAFSFHKDTGAPAIAWRDIARTTTYVEMGYDFSVPEMYFASATSTGRAAVYTQNILRTVVTSGGNFQIPVDSKEIQLGASQDLRFYHDGTDSFVRNDTGQLRLNFSGTNRFSFNNTGGGGNATIQNYQDSAGTNKFFEGVAAAANDLITGTAAGDTFIRAQQYLFIQGNPTIVATVPVRLKVYTVGTLPAGVQGDTAAVSDALAPVFGAAVAAGGAVTVPVYYTGAAWFVG